MNDKIRKLAKKAGATFNKGYIELSDGQLMQSDEVDVDHTNMDLEKFALLLVKQCCDIFVELRTRPADLAVKDVKKHFGVEE